MAKHWKRKKDPDEVLDYGIDWLGTTDAPGELYGLSDAIANSLWVLPPGIASELETNDDGSTTVWISGGADGNDYDCLNRITTDEGRVLDQTVTLKVRNR